MYMGQVPEIKLMMVVMKIPNVYAKSQTYDR